MSFVVEDGTGKTDATSYVSLADADAYWVDRGNATWAAATNADKQIALISATEYLDARYMWSSGVKWSTGQALAWPRGGAYDRFGYGIDDDVVPEPVKAACCQLAVRALSDDLMDDQSQRLQQVKVDNAFEATFAPSSDPGTHYTIVDALLYGLVSSSATVDLVRS